MLKIMLFIDPIWIWYNLDKGLLQNIDGIWKTEKVLMQEFMNRYLSFYILLLVER